MLSVRIKPELEARLVERAKLLNVTKSKLVNELLEQALAPSPNAYEMLQRIRRLAPGEDADSAKGVSEKIKTKLHRKHARSTSSR